VAALSRVNRGSRGRSPTRPVDEPSRWAHIDERAAALARTGRRVQFGCGFLFGSAASLGVLAGAFGSAAVEIGGILGCGVLFGLLAARFGDRVWVTVLERWWP
jgi:hypothetical protein